MNSTEDNVEQFIIENKDKFSTCNPSIYHADHFLLKLQNKFKKIVSIVPYLIRVAMITALIFAVSIWAWNKFLRKDRHEITLKHKIENVITHIKK